MKKAKSKAKPKAKAKATRKVQAIPTGYQVVTPYLSVRGAAQAIDFYKVAFGAKEVMRMPGPGGKLGHAELRIGDALVMLADEHGAMDFLGPQTRGGTTVLIHLYVKDVDGTARRAVDAGGELIRPVQNQFYGDRTGSVRDPFGHIWHLATHVEDVAPAEMRKRAAEMAAKAGAE
jgi:PhnB protein